MNVIESIVERGEGEKLPNATAKLASWSPGEGRARKMVGNRAASTWWDSSRKSATGTSTRWPTAFGTAENLTSSTVDAVLQDVAFCLYPSVQTQQQKAIKLAICRFEGTKTNLKPPGWRGPLMKNKHRSETHSSQRNVHDSTHPLSFIIACWAFPSCCSPTRKKQVQSAHNMFLDT